MAKKVGRRRTRAQVEQDRAIIARLYLRGKTQAEIGEELNLSQQQISYDLRHIQADWRKSSLRDFDELRAEQAAKIDEVERSCWAAWVRSLENEERNTQYADAGSDGQPKPTRAIREIISGRGDDCWMKCIQWCVSKRIELFGLEAPQAIDVTSRGEKLQQANVTFFIPDNGRGDNKPET